VVEHGSDAAKVDRTQEIRSLEGVQLLGCLGSIGVRSPQTERGRQHRKADHEDGIAAQAAGKGVTCANPASCNADADWNDYLSSAA
jgi:hypothetical protein